MYFAALDVLIKILEGLSIRNLNTICHYNPEKDGFLGLQSNNLIYILQDMIVFRGDTKSRALCKSNLSPKSLVHFYF